MALVAVALSTALSPLAQAATTTTKYLNGKISLDSDLGTYTGTSKSQIYAMNPDGSALTRLTNNSGNDYNRAWSPDGSKATLESNRDGNGEIYTVNADGSDETNLTNNAANDTGPKWSPNGTKIAFSSDRDGHNEVYVMNADGSSPTRLTSGTVDSNVSSWSPDGTKLAYYSYPSGGPPQIYTMNADGSGQTRLTHTSSNEYVPLWSPDGTKIAFFSTRDGNYEVYVMNADGSNQVNLTNNPANDFMNAWAPDSSKLFFGTDRDGLAAVYTVNADGSNQTDISNRPSNYNYLDGLSPDGKKLLLESWSNTTNNGDIYSMNLDGSGKVKLTDSSADPNIWFEDSTWQPLPYTQTINSDGSLTSTISADKDYSATDYTIASNETLVLDGKLGNVTVSSGGTLEGTGSAMTITVNSGGIIAPGHSPGCLSSGNLTLNGTYQAQIGGTTACTGYDQIKVIGTVNLTGSTLSTSLVNGFVPNVGDSFTLIDNDASDAVTGTFNGLAEGASFTSQGVTYKVSYTGGTGNDVTLTILKSLGAPNTGLSLIKANPLVAFSITMLVTGGLIALIKREQGLKK